MYAQKQIQKTVKWIVFIAIGMFGFTFALIPLYNVFCQVTGLNGKVDVSTPNRYQPNLYKNNAINSEARVITIEFDTTRNQDLDCEFKPQHPVLQLTVGELTTTTYYVKNLQNRTLLLQAIPSISPGIAAKHLKKLECFCFSQQSLGPYESKVLPLRFWLEPELPSNIKRLTLSYTLFDVSHGFHGKQEVSHE